MRKTASFNSKIISSCPVCGKEGLRENKKCPQCQSNLHVFSIVDNLALSHVKNSNSHQIKKTHPSPPPKEASSNFPPPITQRTTHAPLLAFNGELKFIFGIIGMVFIFCAVIFYLYQSQVDHHMTLMIEQNDALTRTLRSEVNKAKPLQKVLPASSQVDKTVSSEIQSAKHYEYIFSNEDTLWSLAKRYWNQGLYYPVLLAHNPWLSLSLPPHNVGLRVKILKDIQQVKEDYLNLVVHISGTTFFKYQVQPQDTWKSISNNFMTMNEEKKDDGNILERLNSGKFQVGERILVPIEP